MEILARPLPSILDVDDSRLAADLAAMGEPAFRLKQIQRWIYQANVLSFDEMTNLPIATRQRLANRFSILPMAAETELASADGWTTKVLFRLHAGIGSRSMASPTVESVLMRYDPTDSQRGRLTVCASSQAGCAVGCVFCATGQAGFGRQLTSGEIVGQVLAFAASVRPAGERITNVVLMGQGEPLLNLDAVWPAVERLNDPNGFNIGARHLTLSTVGIVPGIRRLAMLLPPIRLAVSLHAPNDELRSTLVPINRKYPLADLIAACREYTVATGRRITFEYALMGGTNDDPALARQLVRLISVVPGHVNLIPINPTPGSAFQRPTEVRTAAFRTILDDAGIPTTVRVERGIDIFAGCGQLRADEARRSAVPA